jgi:hypothetical protein
MKLYVALDYQSDSGHTSNVAFLDRQDAQDCVDEGCASAVMEVETEEIGWMKEAADAAVEFCRDASMGTLEVSTLDHRTRSYEREIYDR